MAKGADAGEGIVSSRLIKSLLQIKQAERS